MTASQRRPLLALIVCLILALVVMNAARGTSSTGQRLAEEVQTAQPSGPPSRSAPDPVPRIAIAYDASGRDARYNVLAREGAQRVVEVFEAEFLEVVAEPDDTDADFEERLTRLADERVGLIFVMGSAYADALAKIAPKYRGTWFGILDDGSVNERNVIGILFNEEQGAFLVGVAAALTSKTGNVGFIGAVQNPLLQKYEAGFSAGARAADPEGTVHVAYLAQPADDAGDSDPVQARKAALRMYDAGADVIFAAAGDASDGVFEAARDRGLWAIGADSDKYLTADPSVRGSILTSMLKRTDVATYQIGMEVANGVPKDGNNVFGVGRDGVGYS
ncbi:MAG TPA: BMP family ABC transporter substrate-binding protein, partial [Candidatus Limnocylindrales bacterium]